MGSHSIWASQHRFEVINMSCVWSQLEEELKVQIDLWEQEHAKAFEVNGQKFVEYVTEQWEMHQLEKERAKQERVSEPSLGRGGGGKVSSQTASARGSSGCRDLAPDFWPCSAPGLCSSWDVSLLLLPLTQQLKNRRQTETEMLYGSTPRTPSKRRGLAPTTPGKVRKVGGMLWTTSDEGSWRPGLGVPSSLLPWERASPDLQGDSI